MSPASYLTAPPRGVGPMLAPRGCSVAGSARRGQGLRLEPLPAGDAFGLESHRGDLAANRRLAAPTQQPAALRERAAAFALVDAEAGRRVPGAAGGLQGRRRHARSL